MKIWKSWSLLFAFILMLIGISPLINHSNLSVPLELKLAEDDPGPIAPIGPHSPPQPIDDEAIT